MKIPLILASFVLSMTLMSAQLESPKYNKIAFWGTWNIPCGIAMYTRHVAQSLRTLGYHTVHYQYPIRPKNVITRAMRQKIRLINIQYEGGIMPHKTTFLGLINTLKAEGIKIVLTMHAEPLYAQELVDAADLAIYHKQPERLHDISKVRILPMGVPVFQPTSDRATLRKKYGFSEDDKILVSTGFMLPTKEIGPIVEYLAPLLHQDPSIKVQLIHPFTPRNPPACKFAYDQVRKVIEEHHLENQIIIITDFILQKTLSERVYLSDVGYQWFNAHTNATSASAKEYISARTPLVVPQCSHYHDLNHAGVIITPFDKKSFTEALVQLLYQPEQQSIMRDHLEEIYQQLNYDTLIKEYHAILETL